MSHCTLTLNNIAEVYIDLGQLQKALTSYNKALPILREIGDRTHIAITLNNIGFIYDKIEQPEEP